MKQARHVPIVLLICANSMCTTCFYRAGACWVLAGVFARALHFYAASAHPGCILFCIRYTWGVHGDKHVHTLIFTHKIMGNCGEKRLLGQHPKQCLAPGLTPPKQWVEHPQNMAYDMLDVTAYASSKKIVLKTWLLVWGSPRDGRKSEIWLKNYNCAIFICQMLQLSMRNCVIN